MALANQLMIFEFTLDANFSFIQGFTYHLNVETDGEKLFIPEWLGNGHIRKINLAPGFGLLVHHYTLKEELILKRIAPQAEMGAVRILCNIQQRLTEPYKKDSQLKQTDAEEYATRITSDNMGSHMHFPANTTTSPYGYKIHC